MWKSEKTVGREVDDEIEFHLAMEAAARERAGDSPLDARVGAERAFGDRVAVRKACVSAAMHTRRLVLAAAGVVLAAGIATLVLLRPDPWMRLSPFTRVELSASTVTVALPDGEEYELVAIDGIEIDAILDHCQQAYGSFCEKRFAEDLVEVLQSMGHEPGRAVDLRLRDPITRVEIAKAHQEMTEENRRAVRLARHPEAIP
jgi:hypothetical protein